MPLSKNTPVLIIPVGIAFLALQELHLQIIGRPYRFILSSIGQLPVEQAKVLYRELLTCTLVSFVLKTPAAKRNIFELLLKFAQERKRTQPFLPADLSNFEALESMWFSGMLASKGYDDLFNRGEKLMGENGLPKLPGGGEKWSPVWNSITQSINFFSIEGLEKMLTHMDSAFSGGGTTDISSKDSQEKWMVTALLVGVTAVGGALGGPLGAVGAFAAGSAIAVAAKHYKEPKDNGKTNGGSGSGSSPGNDDSINDPNNIDLRFKRAPDLIGFLKDYKKFKGTEDTDLTQAQVHWLGLMQMIDTAKNNIGWQLGIKDAGWKAQDKGLGDDTGINSYDFLKDKVNSVPVGGGSVSADGEVYDEVGKPITLADVVKGKKPKAASYSTNPSTSIKEVVAFAVQTDSSIGVQVNLPILSADGRLVQPDLVANVSSLLQ